MVRHLTALAFLPPDEIPIAFAILKKIMPEEAKLMVEWFDDVYMLIAERKYVLVEPSGQIRYLHQYSGHRGNREQIP